MSALLLCFVAGGDDCAVPLACAWGVVSAASLERTADAPAGVVGLVHAHGQQVPVIDLAARLGVSAASARHVLLVHAHGRRFGWRLDAVQGVVLAAAGTLHPPPAAAAGLALALWVPGARKPVLVLDPEHVIGPLIDQRGDHHP